MDGGKFSWAKSKDSVLKTVQGAGELVASYDPDFALIEEVDLNSTRSYHVNEYSILKECLADYDTVFAQNYDSAFCSIHLPSHMVRADQVWPCFQISGDGFFEKKFSGIYLIQ